MVVTRSKSKKDVYDQDYTEISIKENREAPNSRKSFDDSSSIVLLVLLYLLQGVPLGLAMGSLPFILKSKLNYSQLALLSLSQYPYSLKVLKTSTVSIELHHFTSTVSIELHHFTTL